MGLDKLIYTIMIFSVLMIAGFTILVGVNSSYDDVNISTGDINMDVYDLNDELYNSSKDMDAQLYGTELGDDSSSESITKGSFSAIKILKNSYSWSRDIIGKRYIYKKNSYKCSIHNFF